MFTQRGGVCSPRNILGEPSTAWATKNLPVESKMQLGSPGTCISTSFIDKQHL